MGNGEEESQSFSFSENVVRRIDIAEITQLDDYQSLTTSGVLSQCKHKILRPYLRLLAVMGFRSFGNEQPNTSKTVRVLGCLHLTQVIFFIVFGYLLQYMTCLRRDRGFCYKVRERLNQHSHTCYGSVFYSFVIPSLIHFTGYLYVLYLFRTKENEKLENLMERTFLLSFHRTDGPRKLKALVRNLRVFILFGILWMVCSLLSVATMLHREEVTIKWVNSRSYERFLKMLLIISTLWHDMVQATIITSYCMQVQLLSSSLHFLRAKLLQHTIPPLSWIREINEFRQFLYYLNDQYAPAVCLFIVLDISWASSGTIWMLRYDAVDVEPKPDEILNIWVTVLWSFAGIVPFIMAARLTSACSMLRNLGHEIRTRPFVYQDTPADDLNTILLYTSTLKMKCKLFRMPIYGRYLIFSLTSCAVTILILGECHILKLS